MDTQVITRGEVLAYLAGQFAHYAELTGVDLTDEPKTFRAVLHQAFAHGTDEETVKALGAFHALRRFRAALVNAKVEIPPELDAEIAEARDTVAALPYDPPLSV